MRCGLATVVVFAALQAAAAQTATWRDRADLAGEARRAIQDAVPVDAPGYLLQLGILEGLKGPDHDQAAADLDAAFDAARAYRPKATANAVAVAGMKATVEHNVIQAFLDGGEYDHALALARRADVPRGPLYDALLAAGVDPALRLCSGKRGMAGPGGVVVAYPDFDQITQCSLEVAAAGNVAGHTSYDPLALARECAAADGTFPYQGLWLESQAEADPAHRLELMRALLAHAAEDQAPTAETAAALHWAQVSARPLAAELLEATVATLQRLHARVTSGAGDAGDERAAGRRLLALLAELDPSRYDELVSQMPEFRGGALEIPDPSAAPDPNVLLQADLMHPAGDDVGSVAQIRDFTQALRGLSPGSPQAQVAADTANRLLTNSVLETGAVEAALLANAEDRAGAHAAAQTAMARCLDAVDRLNSAVDADYARLSAAEAEARSFHSLDDHAAVDITYTLAAQVAPELAREHVRQSPAAINRPLMLLAMLNSR